MTDVTAVVADAKADVAKVEAQVSFVKANWVKLSLVVIASAVVGFIVRSLI